MRYIQLFIVAVAVVTVFLSRSKMCQINAHCTRTLTHQLKCKHRCIEIDTQHAPYLTHLYAILLDGECFTAHCGKETSISSFSLSTIAYC